MPKELIHTSRISLFRHGEGENHWLRHCEGRNLAWFRITRTHKQNLMVHIGRMTYYLKLR